MIKNKGGGEVSFLRRIASYMNLNSRTMQFSTKVCSNFLIVMSSLFKKYNTKRPFDLISHNKLL